jgi:hypothetical protein
MSNGKPTAIKLDKKLDLLALTVENMDKSLSSLATSFSRHVREHWKNLFWAIPTLLSAVQLIFLLMHSGGK